MADIEYVKGIVRGPMLPVITSFKDDLSLDLDTIQDNVRFLIEHGLVTGKGAMLAVGAGGDFPMLTTDERKTVAQAVVEAAGGQTTVFVGVQHTDPAVCRELAKHAQEIGADGIQVSPTYYYEPSDADVIAFYQMLNDAISIPIMVYNTPWLVGYDLSLDMLDALAGMERVLALKWACDNVHQYLRVIERFAGRLAIVDNLSLPVMAHMLGATGFITHLANIWPEHEIALWEQLDSGDYTGAQAEHQRVNWPWLDFRGRMARITGGEANVVKAAYELIGRRGGPVRPPTRDMSAEHRAELRVLLRGIGVPGVAG
jgi:dihydrodipicolinate synthase/N-acetylneuraminate lyase